jgi:hypothetical protein
MVSLQSPLYPQPKPFFYNDQFTGSDSWADTGLSFQGDTLFSAWTLSGAVYLTWNDGWGASTSGGLSGGCSANMGIATLSADLTTATQKNCMSSFGTLGQTNTGGWSDGSDWKSGGVIDVEDGSTAEGLYWSVFRQDPSGPYTRTNSSIMYSSNGGTTWCAPGHSGASCSANGDAPAANTAEFTSLPTMYFVEYEKGATGSLTVDCQNSYIYSYSTTGDFTATYLMRAARGSNLQLAANWQYYSGAIGGNACTSGNWQSGFSGSTMIVGGSITIQSSTNAVVYIPGYGYVLGMIANYTPAAWFYSSASITGPWVEVFQDGAAANLYGFTGPLLHTLTTDGSGNIHIWFAFSGSSTLDTGAGSTPYSPHFREMTINAP